MSEPEPLNPSEADIQAALFVEKAAGSVDDSVVADTDDEALEPFYRGEPDDCPNGNEHRLTSWASYTAADGFTLKVLDSAQWQCDDLEYTYHVAPENIGPLCAALGAEGGDDLLAIVARRYKDETMPTLAFGSWLKEHGVTYSASAESHPN
ncbi:hypothetical protein [Mycobacterium sp. E2497]|uniref:hypothetical protein n=1 Tax=Mycobacterium sp. E2497 TaxID=1834135 RepID=UPI0007FFA8FF|nr:hypothetical protein [Mycobacterium sp. E2497]OBI24089.1 hypothetical protein A5713_08130 [Mycobacterium sp. E2497]